MNIHILKKKQHRSYSPWFFMDLCLHYTSLWLFISFTHEIVHNIFKRNTMSLNLNCVGITSMSSLWNRGILREALCGIIPTIVLNVHKVIFPYSKWGGFVIIVVFRLIQYQDASTHKFYVYDVIYVDWILLMHD